MASSRISSTSGKPGSRRNKQWECPYCSKHFPDEAKSVQCDTCESWVCLPCSKVPEEMYDLMHKLNDKRDKDTSTVGFKWVCRLDERSLPTLKSMNTTLTTIMKSNNERFDAIEEQVKKVENSIGDKVSEEVSNLKEKLMVDLSAEIDKKMEEKAKEERDRIYREMNLCLFNVPISESSDPQERKSHDTNIVISLFQAVVKDDKIKEPQIKNIFRLKSVPERSEQREGQKHTPVMKVTFVNKHELRLFLNNAKHIKENILLDVKLHTVIVSRDLSVREREANKQLRNELVEKNKEGKNFTIRNGKIVPLAEPSGKHGEVRQNQAPPSS